MAMLEGEGSCQGGCQVNILNASLRQESVYEYGEWIGERSFVDLKVDHRVVATVEVDGRFNDSDNELIAQGLIKLFSDLPAVREVDMDV
jgi:hypothetical protein